jgi:hypothetical protein
VGYKGETMMRWFGKPSLGRLETSKEWRQEPSRLPPRWERPGISRTAFEFLMVFDREWVEGLHRLLAEPDEPPMKRGRVLKYDGKPERFRKWLGIRVQAMRARELRQLVLSEAALFPNDQEVSSGLPSS